MRGHLPGKRKTKEYKQCMKKKLRGIENIKHKFKRLKYGLCNKNNWGLV